VKESEMKRRNRNGKITRGYREHRFLHIQSGDRVEVDAGPIGWVDAVNCAFTDDGLYGKRASYRVTTDDGTKVWVQDSQITDVWYS
jgi:hypothetical protein